MNLFIAYKIQEDWLQVLGIFEKHELAKACLHRYMNQFSDFSKYKWDKEDHSYKREDMQYYPIYNISKVKFNKDLFS